MTPTSNGPDLRRRPCPPARNAAATLALAALFGIRVASAAPAPAAPTGEPAAVLARSELPAKGRAETLMTVSRFGRYAILARSPQGAALQLIDRMAGPGEISGVPGTRDGRLDLFLDRGEYKIVAISDAKGTGKVVLAVRAAAERNPAPDPLLVEQKPVETSLSDFEQRSWWIDVKERRTVALEAAGRNLADLRLWRDGTWLVAAAPATEVLTPSPGRPILDCRLAADLEPGLYRLAAYGGPSQDWAVDSPDHPLYLRFGIPTLPEAGRRRFVASPFGIDRYLVPESATYFRLELPGAREASIQIAPWAAQNPFENGGPRQEIRKQSLPPVAEIAAPSQSGTPHFVVVRAAAGQPYVLQQFELRRHYLLSGNGRYWISSIHSGAPEDSIDATAVVMRYSRTIAPPVHLEPLLKAAAPLDPSTPWARKFNLLEPATVFLDVREPGTYEALARGTDARLRIEPFLLSKPEHYQPPPFQTSGGKWELERGIAVLTIEPARKGILEIAVRAAGRPADIGRPIPTVGAGIPAAAFPDVPLDIDDYYDVYVNDQPGVKTGLVVRPLPLDLANALPIAEAPSQSIDVAFETKEDGTVRADGEDGEPFPIAIDGGAPAESIAVRPGAHVATIRNASGKMRLASVAFRPARLDVEAPLPAIPPAELAALPDFPVLSEKEPAATDLDRAEETAFNVRADAPGLYRLESTGLLATSGSLRTRTNPSFRSESGNGVGRNFLIDEYLREGDYQASVRPNGRSAGHVGMRLSRTAIADGGTLSDRVPARATLPAGHAIAYRFTVPRRAPYRLRALGLGHTFRCRLETADGWPIDRPAVTADITRVLDAGSYRAILLPEPLSTRIVTVLERRQVPRRRSGHGPHFLPLDRTVSYEWRESKPRVPDRWEFTLPAPAETAIALTDEMTGTLSRAADAAGAAPLATIDPARPWKGRLDAGRYRIDAVCARENDRLGYTLSVVPTELLPGLDRPVSAPAVMPVSVGVEGLVLFSSFGSDDVRAKLIDASGAVVAENDDRPDDWNFQIARRLAPGLYRLEVDPVGTPAAAATVSMAAPKEIAEGAIDLPNRMRIRVGNAVRIFPLPQSAAGAMLAASARSVEAVGIALERKSGASWQTVTEGIGPKVVIAVPATDGAAMRLRVWSIDRRGNPVDVSAASISPAAVAEATLAAGTSAAPIPGFSPPTSAVRAALDRPGTFRLDSPAGTAWSGRPGTGAEPTEALLEATGTALWITRELAAGAASGRFAARRVRLDPGAEIAVRSDGEGAEVDVAPHAGPVAAIASSLSGQPGVAFEGESRLAMTIGETAALSVSLRPGARRARVWSAADGRALEVELRTIACAPPGTDASIARGGSWEGAVARGTAVELPLPPGSKTVRLSLSPGLAAAVASGDRVEATAWARRDAIEEEFETEADRVTLLGIAAEKGSAAVSVVARPVGPSPAIAFASPVERNAVRRETLRRGIEGSTGAVLHVRGRDASAAYLSPAGVVRRGTDVPLDPGSGVVLVASAPGPLLCWIEGGNGESGAWGREEASAATSISAPASAGLRGRAEAFRISAPDGSSELLHLRSSTPAVARVGEGPRARTEACPDGIALDLPSTGSPASVALRGFAGQPLSGDLEIDATPILPAAEGLGAEVLVPPGGARGFSFQTKEKGEVGIGVRAASEAIDAELIGPGGARFGTGIVQMPTLDPGTYVLVVHVPRGSAPVAVRPALAGLERPGTGPPADVIRRYLHPEAEAPEPEAETANTREETETTPLEAEPEAAAETEPAGAEAAEAEPMTAAEGDAAAPSTEGETPPPGTEPPPPPDSDAPPPPSGAAAPLARNR